MELVGVFIEGFAWSSVSVFIEGFAWSSVSVFIEGFAWSSVIVSIEELDFPTAPELCFKVFFFFKRCFKSTAQTRRIIRDGKPRTATSTFTQLLSAEKRGLGAQAINLYSADDKISVHALVIFAQPSPT